MKEKYQETKKEIKHFTNEVRISIMKIMLIKGISKGWNKKTEYVEHFDELVEEKDYKYIYEGEKKEWERDLFLDEAFHYINKIPEFISKKIDIPTNTYIYGDDLRLKYTYECDKCGSLITVNYSDNSYESHIVCKHCVSGYNGPHGFTEVGSDEWKILQKWVTYNKRMNTDEEFRKREDLRRTFNRKFYDLTKWFRPGYWKAKKRYNEKHGIKKLKKNEEAKQLLLG
jgi:hypothetical protein